ncbi:MAG: hypothetical protein R2860_10480 [Desulfobacterales bacterium]
MLSGKLDKKIDETDIAVHQPGADASIANMYDKLNNWEAMKITLEAGIRIAKRYAPRLARITAENLEDDPQRKRRTPENCRDM